MGVLGVGAHGIDALPTCVGREREETVLATGTEVVV